MVVEGLQKTRPWSWMDRGRVGRLALSLMARCFFFSTFNLLITCVPWRAITASLPQQIHRIFWHGPRHPVLNLLLLPTDDEKLLNFTVSPVPPHC